MFSDSELILIKNFRFKDGKIKDKFLLVLCHIDDKLLFYSLPSSQIYIKEEDKTEGCIFIDHGESDKTHLYFFPKNKVIGKNRFSFFKDIFLYIPRSTNEIDPNVIKEYVYESKDILIESEYIELLKCLLKSGSLRRK